MADSHLTPAQKRALESLKRPIIQTSEDIHPDHHVPKEEPRNWMKTAREHAAAPVRHSNGNTTR